MKKVTKKIISQGVIFLIISNFGYSQNNIITLADSAFFTTNNDSAILYKATIKFDILTTKAEGNSKLKISLPSEMNKLNRTVIINRISALQNQKRRSYTWMGEIEGQVGSYVLFTIVGEAVSGYIRTQNNEVYKIEYLSPGLHQISRISPIFSKPDGFNTPQLNSTASQTDTECCDSLQIDILVVYSTTAKDAAHGTDAILSQIYECETQTNQTFINSQVYSRINIVNTSEVNYTETGSVIVDLSHLQNDGDGQIDIIHTTRTNNNADIVLMLVENTGNRWGYSNIMSTITHSFKDYAFGVINRSVASSHLIFAHELGHLMGARHEFLDDPALTPFPNSHGYHTLNFRTIMSENAQFQISSPYWSNPDVIYPASGEPTGNLGPEIMSNDAYTLNQTRVVISRFMCSDNCGSSRSWWNCWWFWIGVAILLALLVGSLRYFSRRNRS